MKTEMDKLQNWLDKNNIQYIRRRLYDGEQILIKEGEIDLLSCICHSGSYGYEKGLIEIYNFEDDPIGYLTAEKCKKIIKKCVLFN